MMMKGESEVAARVLFECKGRNPSAWENYRLGVLGRSRFDVPGQRVSQQLVPGGNTLTDIGVRGDNWVRSGLGLSGRVQHGRWLFPAIQPNVSRNVGLAVKIMLEPHKLFSHSAGNAPGAAFGTGGRL